MKRILLLVVLLVFLGGKYGDAATIYVNHAAMGSNNGTSWANAYTSLQQALDAAAAESGNEIWVAKGTYKPSSDYGLGGGSRSYHFRMIDGVAIYGGFAGTETAVSQRTNFRNGETNETILSGDIGAVGDYTDNCYHVIYIPGGYGLTLSAVLDGFTISGGNANGTGDNLQGGGICNKGGSFTLNNITICNNKASNDGGGLFFGGSGTEIFNITNFSIYSNNATTGGGINLNIAATLNLTNGLIYNNTASGYGGGIETYTGSTVNLTNVTIANNNANADNNSSGGGIDNWSSTITLNNCIIWGNSANNSGNQINSDGTTTLNNSCYSNGSNDVQGSVTANNCTTSNPLFVDAAGSDFRIYGNSPCVNSGNNSYIAESYDIRGQARIQNSTVDMGAYEWTTGVDPTVPSATTNAATNLTVSGATLNGSVTANLASTVVTFEYGLTTSYGTSVTADQSPVTGSTATTVSKAISGLSANTTYHCRVVAVNGGGTTYGSDQTFTTPTAGTFTGNTNNDWNTAGNWGSGSVPTSATDVTIPTGKNVVIGPTTTANCNNLTVDGTLTIESSDVGTGSLIISGTTSGTAIVQRYMTKDGWHLIASPVTGQTVGSFLSASNTIASNPSVPTNKAMKDYNETTNNWNGLTYYTTTTDEMVANKGYSVWPSTNGIASFTGTLQSGSKDVSVVKAGYGWNCIGNPYTSAIAINSEAHASNNFLGLNSTKFASSYEAIYVWQQDPYGYLPINNAYSGAYYIPVGQAFFVRTSSTGSFSFSPALQSHQNGAVFKSTPAGHPTINIEAAQNSKKCLTTVKFIGNCTPGLDVGYDAGMMKTGFDVFTRLLSEANGVDFALQCLPMINSEGYTIPVGLESSEIGKATLKVSPSDLPVTYKLILEDRLSGLNHEIKGSSTVSVDLSAGKTQGRFYLKVSDASMSKANADDKVLVYRSNGHIVVLGIRGTDAVATLYDVQGRKVGHTPLYRGRSNEIPTIGMANGVYLLKIEDRGMVQTQRVQVSNE